MRLTRQRLRSEAATRGDDTPETAPRGGDGKVADGAGEDEKPWHVVKTGSWRPSYLGHWSASGGATWVRERPAALSWGTLEEARAIQEQVKTRYPQLCLRLQRGGFPDGPLRSEAAPQQERAQDTWYLYLALAKPVYLGDGEEVWWTKDKASARKFASAGEARGVFDRLHPSSLGGKLYICCDPGPPRITFEQALHTEGVTCTKRGEVLSASVDERGSLTVHLATDDKGNVVSAMSEVRAAIEATGSRKMEPEENGMKKNLRTEGANAPVREDGTTLLLWHKHDNSYLGRPGGFDEEGLATRFASQAEAEQFRDEHVSQRLRNVVVAVPRPKQKLCVEDAPTRPSEPSLRVVAAAVWHGGMIYSLPRPARHHNILHKLHELGLPAAVGGHHDAMEQGFLLSDGAFVGRALAAAIALAAGQVQKLTAPPELYSEDLW